MFWLEDMIRLPVDSCEQIQVLTWYSIGRFYCTSVNKYESSAKVHSLDHELEIVPRSPDGITPGGIIVGDAKLTTSSVEYECREGTRSQTLHSSCSSHFSSSLASERDERERDKRGEGEEGKKIRNTQDQV